VSWSKLSAQAARVLDVYREKGWMVATAESCTGGLIIGCLTEVAGSSAVVDRGFVTYTNAAKNEVLGVDGDLLERLGAVSQAVARAMAQGALAHSGAEVAVAVTGVAGPGGGTVEKPVGLVHLACARRGGAVEHLEMHYGARSRQAIREATVASAFEMLLAAAEAA
jgi:nicotinamide-nucleotide amidase